jgi:hypothetical protein
VQNATDTLLLSKLPCETGENPKVNPLASDDAPNTETDVLCAALSKVSVEQLDRIARKSEWFCPPDARQKSGTVAAQV